MTRYDRYLAGRVIAALLRSIVALVLLFILFDLTTHRLAAIIRNQVPWPVVAEYYAVFTPTILVQYQIAALAIMVAGLLVLGAAAERREITALLAAGVSLRRLVRAPLLVALAFVLVLFAFGETIGTAAAKRAEEIETRYYGAESIRRDPVSWANLPNGWQVHVQKFNRLAMTGEDALLLLREPGRIEKVHVRRLYWAPEDQAWLMEDGLWSVFNTKQNMAAEHRRITQTHAPFNETPERLFAFTESEQTNTAPELATILTQAREWGVPARRLAIAYHNKFAKPFLAFVMMALAIPFAMRLRRGGVGVGLGIGVAVGLAYLLVYALTQSLGQFGHIPPIAAAWSANLAFLALAAVLFARTPT